MYNYNNRRFKAIHNSENGEVDDQMVFHYFQNADIVTCNYSGTQIKAGHLIAVVNKLGNLDMRYHQVNYRDEIRTGICHSRPEILNDGRLRLHEKWQWTGGDISNGASILEEIL